MYEVIMRDSISEYFFNSNFNVERITSLECVGQCHIIDNILRKLPIVMQGYLIYTVSVSKMKNIICAEKLNKWK